MQRPPSSSAMDAAPVLHYMPIKSNSSAQKNVNKSNPGSQADFDSIVFYIPVNSLNAVNSVNVGPGVQSTSRSALTPTTHTVNVSENGLEATYLVHSASASPVATAVSSPTNPIVSSVLRGSPTVRGASASPVATGVSSPVSPIVSSVLRESPTVRGALASPVATAVSSPARPVASSVLSGSPGASNSIAASPFSPTANYACSPKLSGILSESNPNLVAKQVKNKPQVKRPAEALVASLVFFDLETTGLAHEIGKANVQITEISMIAMSRKDFQNSSSSELKDIRVIQKICLCTRPRASISPGAAKVTGLKDANLIDQHPFDQNAAAVITTFLTHLPKPVCLIAHNGACYDFPLLVAEFNRMSIHLPSDILVADTLKAFRALGVPVFPPERKIAKSVKYGKQGTISYALDNLHLYFFNKKPIGSHSSEGDCIALAKVCQVMKDLMLPWIDENCSTIDNVVPMW